MMSDPKEPEWRREELGLKHELLMALLQRGGVSLDGTPSAIPELRGVVRHPGLGPDGQVISANGFNPESGLFYCGPKVSVPEAPTRDDALAALAKLRSVWRAFPFVSGPDGHDAAIPVVLALTILARRALPTSPIFLVRGPQPSVGKSKCFNASFGAAGRPEQEETCDLPWGDANNIANKLVSWAKAQRALVWLDDFSGTPESTFLAGVVTQGKVNHRLQHSNDTPTYPWVATIAASSSGAQLGTNLRERTLTCDLDARCADPSLTQFDFDAEVYAREHCIELAEAGLTILRAYLTAGRPAHGKPRWSKFIEWDSLVRGAALWVGLADPMAGRSASALAVDVERAEFIELLRKWPAKVGVWATSAELVTATRDDPDWRFAVEAWLGAKVELNAQRFGRALGKKLRHKVGGANGATRWIEAGSAHNTSRWVLCEEAGPGTALGPSAGVEAGAVTYAYDDAALPAWIDREDGAEI